MSSSPQTSQLVNSCDVYPHFLEHFLNLKLPGLHLAHQLKEFRHLIASSKS